MNARHDICAVVLTLNEEVNIERCLDSLDWCDDLVVLDSDSTDKTVAIAERMGARVYVHRPEGPYRISDQRNWALDHCEVTAKWVLFIDADEAVPPKLAERIRLVCSDEASDIDAYQLTPKYLFWGTWMKRCMGYPNWHDRLLRHGQARIAGGVWEHFVPGTRIGRIDEPYLHYGNSKGFSEWLSRHDRYSTWNAQQAVSYLKGGGSSAFGTRRRLRLRKVAARLWPMRPVLRFLVMYILRGGFLDGPAALVFCLRYAIFEHMTVEKIAEIRRVEAGLPL